ncbi:hypothetical protein T261_4789 [Streptomyces lydicus]|nr:hypothetical protein T261_4789 [Streptomyces lydicus]
MTVAANLMECQMAVTRIEADRSGRRVRGRASPPGPVLWIRDP